MGTKSLSLLLSLFVGSAGAFAAEQMGRPYGGRALEDVLLYKALKKNPLMAAARVIREALRLVGASERRLSQEHIVLVDPRVDFASGWQEEDLA